MKTILKIDLKDGKDYCGKNILSRFQSIIPQLKVLNIPITIVCDSGYENKEVFGLGLSHNNDFKINQSLAQLATLAYNAKNMFVAENLSEQFSDKLVKLSTLQRDFIHIPGILVNHSGKKILKLTVEGLDILKNHFLNFGYKLAL